MVSGNDGAKEGRGRRSMRKISRRSVLAASGTAGALSLSGCLGSLGGGGSDSVKVGFAVALSGPYSLIGNSIINGFKLRIEEQLDNEIDGREVEYVQKDTGGEPGTGASVAKEFIQREEVDFVVGPVSGAVAGAMFPVFEQNPETTWLNPNAGNPSFKENCLPNFFLTCYHHDQLSLSMAPWVLDELGIDKVHLSYADYVSGKSYTSLFAKGFEEAGGTITGEVAPPLGTEDYTPFLQDIADSDADGVWSFFAGSDAINYIKQFHDFGLDQGDDAKTQMGVQFLLSTDVIPAQGAAAVGKYSVGMYTPTKSTPRNEEFVQAYQSAFDRAPNIYACNGFDTAQCIETGVSEGGGTDVESVGGVLEGLELDSPAGYRRIDAEGHYPVQDIDIREVVSGGDGPPKNEVVTTLEKVAVDGPLCSGSS